MTSPAGNATSSEPSLTFDIELYTETLINNEWIPDNIDSYHTSNALTHPVMLPSYFDVESKLWKLFTMGGQSYPFGLCSRNPPNNLSKELKSMGTFQSAQGLHWLLQFESAGYFTIQELKSKAVELVLLGTQDSLEVLPRLLKVIQACPDTTEDLNNQRAIFWFT